jgi:hypothetical protein
MKNEAIVAAIVLLLLGCPIILPQATPATWSGTVTATISGTISISTAGAISFGTIQKGQSDAAYGNNPWWIRINETTTVITDSYICIDNETYASEGIVVPVPGTYGDNCIDVIKFNSSNTPGGIDVAVYNTYIGPSWWQDIPVPGTGGTTINNYIFYTTAANQIAGTYGGTVYVKTVENGQSPGTPH